MICLSKNLNDPYINLFAESANLEIQDSSNHFDGELILLRGLGKKRILNRYLRKQYDFYYMDSGYVGNWISDTNPYGKKVYHRIVKNDLQHNEVIPRPSDRWEKLKYPIKKRKRGEHILLVTPSEKPCKFYQIDRDEWIRETIQEIKKYTDRPIKIRNKVERPDRIKDPIFNYLDNCHALVTYQSIAAIESILYGVPAFTLAPTAADSVANKELKLIENPTFYDKDEIYQWACHLAYGQFHDDELMNGIAYKILMEEHK